MNNSLYGGNNYIPNQNMMGMNYQDNYVENYLRKNLGKNVELHVSFCDSIEWRDSIFTGILEDVGKDFTVIKRDDKKYVIWNIYIDYLVLND